MQSTEPKAEEGTFDDSLNTISELTPLQSTTEYENARENTQNEKEDQKQENAHSAGYDSFATGYIFAHYSTAMV
jgi:hypothetical protein